jgi:hypothetical protein
MNSRERVLAALNHHQQDCTPLDFDGHHSSGIGETPYLGALELSCIGWRSTRSRRAVRPGVGRDRRAGIGMIVSIWRGSGLAARQLA